MGTGMLVSSCGERVVVTICHTKWHEPMKQCRLVTRRAGYFTEITRLGASRGHLDDLQHRNSQGTKCTVRHFGSILHLCNNIICHLRHFQTLPENSQCMKTGSLTPLCRFLSGPVTCCTMSLCVGSLEGGAGRSQWANVWGSWAAAKVREQQSPPLSTFQCVLYSPARHGHPRPVPATH